MNNIKLQNVLVPIDNSPYMSELAEKATAFAKKTGSAMTFLYAIDMATTASEGEIEQQQLTCRKVANSCRDKAVAQGVSASSRIEIGSPAEAIINMAEREQFDLIIIGSRGHSRLTTLLVGSVADQVMEHAPCPVMLLR